MRNAQLIFIFFLIAISQCATACSQIDKGKWHDETCVYINKTYNLQWDLSGAKWRIAEDYRLPKDMIFAQLCKMISLAFLYVHFNLKKN